MDAGLRPAARLFLEFHPARDVSRRRSRLPARQPARPAHCLVSARAVGRRARGEVPPPRGGHSEQHEHLFHERHHRQDRVGRKHAAAAAAVRDGGGALRHGRASDGPRALGASATAGVRDQSSRQPRRRGGVRVAVVVPDAAERLVRCRVSRGRAAAPAARTLGDAGRRRRARSIAVHHSRHGARQPVVAVLPDHRLAGGLGHGHRGEQRLSSIDGAARAQGILLPVALRRVRRHVRQRTDSRRRERHRRGVGASPRREACRCRRNRSGDPASRRDTASRPSVRGSARHRHQRRCAALSGDDDEEVRPDRIRADRFAHRAIELLERPPRELHVHRGIVSRCPRSPGAARNNGALQLLPREVARRSARQHGRPGVRTGAARARPPGARVSRGDVDRSPASVSISHTVRRTI